MNTAMPTINPKLISADKSQRLFAATLTAMRRIQRERPTLWEKIDCKAKELQEAKAH